MIGILRNIWRRFFEADEVVPVVIVYGGALVFVESAAASSSGSVGCVRIGAKNSMRPAGWAL